MSDIKLTEEERNRIKSAIKEKLFDELKAEIKQELEEEIRAELKLELESKLKTELKLEPAVEVAEEPKAKAEEEEVIEQAVAKTEEESQQPEAKVEEESQQLEVKVEESQQPEVKAEEESQELDQTDNSSKKKGFTFKKFLVIYVVIWLIITLLASVYLWKSIAAYQNNYENAEAKANPDILAENSLSMFSRENIRETGKEVFSNISIYESDEAWNKYLDSVYSSDSISFNRVENFSITKPVYDIYCDNNLIGQLTLSETGDADKYGFHGYEVKTANVLIAPAELKTYTITAPVSANIIVNGNDITKTETPVDEILLTDSVHAVASEKSGQEYKIARYEIGQFIEQPEVKSGNNKISLNEDNVFEYNNIDETYLAIVQDRVKNADTAYIKCMNLIGGFGGVSGYLVGNSNAYKNIQSAMAGLSWAGAPEEFEIKDSEIKELWVYDEHNIVVLSHYSIHRVYRGVTYEEEMTIESLYTSYRGDWYIQEMALKR